MPIYQDTIDHLVIKETASNISSLPSQYPLLYPGDCLLLDVDSTSLAITPANFIADIYSGGTSTVIIDSSNHSIDLDLTGLIAESINDTITVTDICLITLKTFDGKVYAEIRNLYEHPEIPA